MHKLDREAEVWGPKGWIRRRKSERQKQSAIQRVQMVFGLAFRNGSQQQEMSAYKTPMWYYLMTAIRLAGKNPEVPPGRKNKASPYECLDIPPRLTGLAGLAGWYPN